ncbi:MAG: FAD-dependent oxidoreductase, partial [Desulfobacterales bacterium]
MNDYEMQHNAEVGLFTKPSRLKYKTNMESSPNKPVGKVIVVGGGIGGIQCALDLADTGFYVYLLEKSHTLGGA